MDKILILKTLVGSRANGLATGTSDYDYRGVYITPTEKILSLDFNYKGSSWIEGKEDNTSYEIGHFLHLAIQCNPSILEVMVAPIVNNTEEDSKYLKWGFKLRELFPYVWDPKRSFDAFTGYSKNQQKKMLDNHLGRWQKYGLAYIRTLYNLIDLLSYKTFKLEITNPERLSICKLIRDGSWTPGEIIDKARILTAEAEKLLILREDQKQNIEVINDFLLEIRKEFWK